MGRYAELGLLDRIEYLELDDITTGSGCPQRNGKIDVELFEPKHKMEILRRAGIDTKSVDEDVFYSEQAEVIDGLFNETGNQEIISAEIAKLNQALRAQQAGIITVADKYRIPLLASEGKRSGHNGVVLVEPCGSPNRIIVDEEGKVIRITAVDAIDPPQQPEPLRFLAERASKESEKPATDFCEMRLEPINERAQSMDFSEARSASGGEIDLVMRSGASPDKGLLLINKSEADWVSLRNLESLWIRGMLGQSAAIDGAEMPFVVFANDGDSKVMDRKFLDNQRDLIEKFSRQHEIATPIFFAPDLLRDTPDLIGSASVFRDEQVEKVQSLAKELVENAISKATESWVERIAPSRAGNDFKITR
ncbi:MAG: hypothetical protein KGP29_02070 [Proteobacteria bacterium]|nr:hypothetical protein [Pseudomonadota bacterium]